MNLEVDRLEESSPANCNAKSTRFRRPPSPPASVVGGRISGDEGPTPGNSCPPSTTKPPGDTGAPAASHHARPQAPFRRSVISPPMPRPTPKWQPGRDGSSVRPTIPVGSPPLNVAANATRCRSPDESSTIRRSKRGPIPTSLQQLRRSHFHHRAVSPRQFPGKPSARTAAPPAGQGSSHQVRPLTGVEIIQRFSAQFDIAGDFARHMPRCQAVDDPQ